MHYFFSMQIASNNNMEWRSPWQQCYCCERTKDKKLTEDARNVKLAGFIRLLPVTMLLHQTVSLFLSH